MNRPIVVARRGRSRRWLGGGIALAVAAVAAVAAASAFGSGGGIITTLAGTGLLGHSGDGGRATLATFYNPDGVAVDGHGNVYIADVGNSRVRKVSPDGTITNYAGTGTAGFSGDGGPATSAQLKNPKGLAVDGQGNLYIADWYRVRKVSPGGTITTIAGSNGIYLGDGGPATSAALNTPTAVAVDGQGNVFITDTEHQLVRKVSPDGIITTLAGTGGFGFSGDGGPATSAELRDPDGVAVDGEGNVYIADSGNNRVRKVSPDGTISTVAGTGTAGLSGDGGPATSAELYYPSGVAVDGQGRLYIYQICEIRKVSGGTITTIAGTNAGAGRFSAFGCGYSGDGGPATSAQIGGGADGWINSVAVDAHGNVYIADWENNRVREIAPGLAAQAITFTSGAPAAAVVGGPAYTVAARGGGSGNAVRFSSAKMSVCAVSGAKVSFVGVGTCTIDANQAGNSQYAAAQTTTQSFAVAGTKKKQKLCVVPKLRGKSLPAAKRALKNAHCAVGKITTHKSSTVSKGRVISSSPKAASKHKAGAKVALTVSRGTH